MKIKCLVIGKTTPAYLVEGCDIFLGRLKHYTDLEYCILKDVKVIKDRNMLLKAEADHFLSNIEDSDYVVLLDEGGKRFTSESFAQWIEHHQTIATRRLIFIVGGAYGFHSSLYERAQIKISLSELTFSHQMVRLFFIEQLYRAFTIINNEKYHNN